MCASHIEKRGRGMEKTPATDDFWAEFTAASGVTDVDYTVVGPGDTDELADELVGLMLSGVKRATASFQMWSTPKPPRWNAPGVF